MYYLIYFLLDNLLRDNSKTFHYQLKIVQEYIKLENLTSQSYKYS